MKQLKIYTITGIIFVLIVGSISHFFYEWSGNNFIIGLFSPVNESAWEHMKLLFFPMLLYSFIMILKLRSDYPCVTFACLTGILLGTLLIPVIFYTYTGIIGHNLLALDIGTFVLSVLISFYTIYRLTLTCSMPECTFLLYALVCLLAAFFMVFSYFPPDIPLFLVPHMT